MKISIIGCGYVGTVTGVCFASFGHDIVFYDIDQKKLDLLARGESPIYEPSLEDLIRKNRQRLVTTSDLTAAVRDTDITFICVGTPSRDDGSIDLTYILSAGATIGKALRETPDFHPIIVKSTVFPGSTEGPIRSALEEASGKQAFVDFGLGSNPEFLREGNAVHDFCVPDRIILGAKDARTMRALGDLYTTFTCPKIETSIRTAEMIKYTSNAFLATKISFANEIGNLAKKLGIDAEEVFAGVGLDNRIGPAFFRTGIGFGGSCFPKDVRALIAGAGDHHENLQILHAALRVNEDQPLKLVRLLQAHIPDLKGRRIGILGLAFKPDTDDIRESRAIPVIRALLDAGAVVVAYDPLAMESFSKIFPEIEYASSAQAVLAADAILITTEWEEFERLNYSGTTVIDGRRIAAASKTADIYEGVCW
ncbi:UDP-glucose/GDP-mannose dehydrogenase family protein [Methanoculleus sp. FWC-SCC3]|uniref:UDP-glucose 6-dehydrogenase n=1 Tax=Methanoculleus methanifontis TaxID=2584086 RepID=A0ABT8M5I8_9EURY|nr:UDP-glucose/GDP-mannose dehydrogenase family protein [Methanoculleus sp. FWC-SCC3]MDN7013865.1 UDP-glucose/GDP-mannose dehydrogenase family protein [Methanoculleus sp. FWC-SCC3]